MTVIKSSKEGIADILNRFKSEEIIGVEIPSRTPGYSYPNFFLDEFQRNGLYIPAERRVTYVPPDEVSHRNFTERHFLGYAPYRVEQIPQIEDPALAYIIIDDQIESGGTLASAVKALGGQGVARENIWFSTILVFGYSGSRKILVDKLEAYAPFAPCLRDFLEGKLKD